MNKIKHFNPMKLREKYSIKPSNYNYSSFWLDNDWDTSFDDTAWITEEAAFLKGCYKKEVSTLDPKKSLLMTCHTSNTSAKDSYLSVETATTLNLEDFVSDEEDVLFFKQRLYT